MNPSKPFTLSTRHIQYSIFFFVIGLLSYIVLSIYLSKEHIITVITKIGINGFIIALILSLVNYFLRFLRWQIYLYHLGYKIKATISGQIYFSGFALTLTPAKVGEVVRSMYLKRCGVPIPDSLAVLISERLSDLLAIVLLSCLGLTQYEQAHLPIAITIGLIIIFSILVLYPPLTKKLAVFIEKMKTGRIKNIFTHLIVIFKQVQSCHSPTLLLLTIIISLIAWSAEAVAFYLLLHWAGFDLSLIDSFFIYGLSMLAGALSFLPGGLGGAEGIMISLLLLHGIDTGSAVALTIFIRLTTLWFAIALGAVTLYHFQSGKKHVL